MTVVLQGDRLSHPTGPMIYDNLRKVAGYLLAVHVPIAGLALFSPLSVGDCAAVHIVLLELVMDPTSSIIFELERPDANVMNRRPRGRSEHLFEARRVGRAVALGVAALFGPLAVVAYCVEAGSPAETLRTLWLRCARRRATRAGARLRGLASPSHANQRNPATAWLPLAVGAVLLMTIVIPPLRRLFHFALVDWPTFGLAAAIGAAPVFVLSIAFNWRRLSLIRERAST